MHAVDNDFKERLVSSNVSYAAAGESKRQRFPSNLSRPVIAFLLCLVCVVVFWIITGVFRTDNPPQTGFNAVHALLNHNYTTKHLQNDTWTGDAKSKHTATVCYNCTIAC